MSIATAVQTVDWPGASGRTYPYWVYALPPNFNAAPGNYIFAKRNADGRWTPVYIGQTGDLSERFDFHHAMPCVIRNGATHIHAHRSGGEAERRGEEADLLANFNPPCNRT
jgi:hypothetical protein